MTSVLWVLVFTNAVSFTLLVRYVRALVFLKKISDRMQVVHVQALDYMEKKKQRMDEAINSAPSAGDFGMLRVVLSHTAEAHDCRAAAEILHLRPELRVDVVHICHTPKPSSGN